ncbi:MAG: hypothetical protein EPN70_01520 [Paraburkholderia sp.]|uniref:hypothetical protein n=1 Tax=Paraburkholderia sp. TaxID=1926495 RepID=UPI0012080F37|nr:hypothetical protein [Paraburkholderia sp.]TAM07942.1 MAG: hypothetical protein EPN70_01520 [Paraburkholderia sp.]TAM31808.1 MAG: hypothetical protein EPN59_04230 [Paraburkholderia sp.]
MAIRTYTDLPLDDRAAFELACARHGFTPVHFDISGLADPDDPAHSELLVVRRGAWAQAYRVDSRGQWLRQFEVDLNGRFFRLAPHA